MQPHDKREDAKEFIYAYFCPFKTGSISSTDAMGWVDVPVTPETNRDPMLVFTPGMNGCLFAAIEKKNDPKHFRVFHVQNPSSGTNAQWKEIMRSNADLGMIISTYDYSEYSVDK